MNKELRVIILAAGKGTRMNSDLPKVLHKLQGKALIDYVIDESELLDPKEIILVVGFKKEQVIKHTKNRFHLKYATQVEQLGTGHAVLQTKELLKNKIHKFTVSNALGQGKEVPITEVYRGIAHEISLLKKVRLEIAVNDEYVDNAVDSIVKVAQRAKDKGRGKIFILPVEECIRLRTNERGKEAIG